MWSGSSEDDDDIVLYYYLNRRRRNLRRFWIHPYIRNNVNCRLSVAAREMRETDNKFVGFYRMSKDSYLNLVQLIAPAINKNNTIMRECVSAEERILITLR